MTIVYFSIRVDRDGLNMDTLMKELYYRQKDTSEQSPRLLHEDDKLQILEVV